MKNSILICILLLNFFVFILVPNISLSVSNLPNSVISLPTERDPRLLNPFTYITLTEWTVHQNIVGTLVELDNENQIRSGLAQKWQVNNNGKQYVFYLRNNRYWSDGSKITSEDILKSFTAKKKHNSSKFLEKILDYKNYKLPIYLQNDTLVFNLTRPVDKFLYFLTRPEYGIVDWKNFETDQYYSVGKKTSGDYKISYLNGSKIILEPNNYNNRILDMHPKFIMFKRYLSHDQILKDLAQGKIDFYQVQTRTDMLNGAYSKNYNLISGGLDNLATIQSRKLSGDRLQAFIILSDFLNKKEFIKFPRKISNRLAAYTSVPESSFLNQRVLTVKNAIDLLSNKKYHFKLALGSEASHEQIQDAKIIKKQAQVIGINVQIIIVPDNKKKWEDEDYELTMTLMGVYTYDEAELFHGYLCAGYKPYQSLRNIACEDLKKASEYSESSVERIKYLRIAYEKILASGKIIPLYYFPRQFLVNKKLDISNHNNLLPYPVFRNFRIK